MRLLAFSLFRLRYCHAAPLLRFVISLFIAAAVQRHSIHRSSTIITSHLMAIFSMIHTLVSELFVDYRHIRRSSPFFFFFFFFFSCRAPLPTYHHQYMPHYTLFSLCAAITMRALKMARYAMLLLLRAISIIQYYHHTIYHHQHRAITST